MKCQDAVLSLQPMIPPKRFVMFFPLTGGCSEGVDAFRFFFIQKQRRKVCTVITHSRTKDQPG